MTNPPPTLGYAHDKPTRATPAQLRAGKALWFAGLLMLAFAVFIGLWAFDVHMLTRTRVYDRTEYLGGGFQQIIYRTAYGIAWTGIVWVLPFLLPPTILAIVYLLLGPHIRAGRRAIAIVAFILAVLHTLGAAFVLVLFWFVGMYQTIGGNFDWWQRAYAAILVTLAVAMFPFMLFVTLKLFDAVFRKIQPAPLNPRAALTAAAIKDLEPDPTTDEDAPAEDAPDESEKPT